MPLPTRRSEADLDGANVDIDRGPVPVIPGSWIGRVQVGGSSTFAVRNPYSGDIVAAVSHPTPEQVEKALAQAWAARSDLAALPAHRRADALRRVAAGLHERFDEFASTITAGLHVLVYFISNARCFANVLVIFVIFGTSRGRPIAGVYLISAGGGTSLTVAVQKRYGQPLYPSLSAS